MSAPQFSQDAFCKMNIAVRYGEAGENGIATPGSVGNWLQEAAGLSAEKLGFGASVFAPLGLAWILNRLVLRISRLPAAGEFVTVRTWPSRLDRFGHRGYQVMDAQGTMLLEGGSAWSVFNLKERCIAPIPDFLREGYPKSMPDCIPFSCRVLPKLKNEEFGSPILVRREDLDINGHVNNTHYFNWLFEPLPSMEGNPDAPAPHPVLADIAFRAECFPGDRLVSAVSAGDAGLIPAELLEKTCSRRATIHSIRKEDGTEACRALMLWA